MRWFERLRRAFEPADRIGDDAWGRLLDASAWFARLDGAERVALRRLSEHFLRRKRFSAAGGHVLADEHCLTIAAMACVPALHLEFDAHAGWRDVVVYPGEFRVRRSHHDEDTGVVTEGDDALVGEAWEHGPLVLSWADVRADLADPFAGFNVVVHEVAHKLDMLDGAMNGVPRLPPAIARSEWIATMQAGFDRLGDSVERGRTTLIDPYATESAEEYFAVVAEHHLSDPAGLARADAAVSSLLRRYFGR